MLSCGLAAFHFKDGAFPSCKPLCTAAAWALIPSIVAERVFCLRAVQVLVEAATSDGQSHSHLLQNAETVRLVGPRGGAAAEGIVGGASAAPAWRAVSVSELQEGDEVWVLRQGGARHTGVSIEESIVER